MGEYSRVTGESSGAIGGGGSGSADVGVDVMGVLSDLLDQLAALPAEILVLFAAVVIVGGIVMTLRPT